MTTLKELVNQRIVGVKHIPIGFQDIFRIVTANALLPPPPQVERNLTIFHVLTQVLAKDVEITVLVNGQLIVEPNVVVQEVLSPVNFPVNKSRVHLMVDIDHLFSVWCPCFFLKHGKQTVKSVLNLTEHNVQTTGVKKHIISIAEHDVFRCRIIKAGVPCC